MAARLSVPLPSTQSRATAPTSVQYVYFSLNFVTLRTVALWILVGLGLGSYIMNAISLEPTGYFLKDGRGHVCKSDPSPRGTDQAHAGHLVIRYRAP